ncbi:M23 family metallopeptidase [uncultured Prevotella sp.]|uniref:M23 family metallopeptidase n=1 Tax=uncultured Prevotella sp. TaxID=159272 RepID=UPI0026391EBD|nr:M23 family metallopeptidase [uncultured Prevotella sp.]
MQLRRTLKTLAITAVMALATVPAAAQDLLARQAPVDKKLKAVDTLALRSMVQREQAAAPSGQLYKDWNNRYAHRASELPDSFNINLRHFCMPTTSRIITSNFGSRWGRMHKGLDIKVYIGDTIRAAFDGKVRIVRYEANGYGNYVVIRHHNGLETIYGHMSKHLVGENETVHAGDPIGLGGNTGRSTGSHLHFETRLCGVALNPALMFDFKNQDVTGDYYFFRKDTYNKESLAANRVRGKESTDLASADNENIGNNVEGGNVRYHKVSRGETLASIARKRGTTIEHICKLNHITKTMRVKPGQILRYS